MHAESPPALAHQTLGEPSNPAIMLLHGFMSCNGQWLLNVEALARDYFLVMVELWGHGDSPTPSDPSLYSIDAYINQFEAIRHAQGIEHWTVTGQSYGAGLVIHYALQLPQHIDKVVVTNSRSAFGPLTNRPRDRRDAAAAQSHSQQTDVRKLPYHPIHARRFPDHVKETLVEKADAITHTAIQLGGALGGELNCTQRLAELKKPLLLTNGVYEKSFQTDLAALQERYPDLRVAVLEGGHSVNIEAADGFNQAVLAFLAEASPA